MKLHANIQVENKEYTFNNKLPIYKERVQGVLFRMCGAMDGGTQAPQGCARSVSE